MMKKITLLIVSLLLLTGGAMAQPDALPDGAGTLKAEGDNLKAVYTQTEGWVINAGKKAEEINLTSVDKVLQCGIDGDLKTIYHGETIDVSKMTNLHLDIYPTKVNENGVLGIFVYSNGVPADWRGIEISGITANKWNSIDIDLSKYPSNPLSPITALAISGGVNNKNENNAGSGFVPHPNETEIYVANAYFYAYADDSKPTLTTSVKNTTSNSITFLAKAVKAKETVGEEITYTVTYNGNNNTFIAQSGVETDLIIDGLESETEYNFTIKATDANGISSKEQPQTVKTLKETALQPTSIPDLKTGYGKITELYTKGENKNGYNWNSWGGSNNSGKDIEIGNGKAFLIENFTYYGSGFTKVDGTGMTLHVDVYPLQDIDLGIIPITNDGKSNVDRYGQTFKSLKRGEWHELELTLNDFKDNLSLTDLYQIKYVKQASIDGTGGVVNAGGDNSFYVGNVYLYNKAADDGKDPVITSPTVTFNDINEDDVHVNSVKVSFSGADETNEEVKFDVWVKNITDNEVEYRGGFARAKNNEKVTYYLKGLKTGKEYEIYVKVRDFSENEGKSEVKTFTTKSYEENISIKSCTTNADNGGIVVLNGKWNVEEFNKIAAEYPYGCFDVRNVVFDDGLRHDRGPSGIQLFNHNAYFITDIDNNFDGNYAIPDEEGKLIGMNFQWYDGDFKPDGGPASYVNYQTIIDDYKVKHKTDSYPGLSGSGYIKMDPYTGYDIHFENQGISIHRMLHMKTLSGIDGFNIYSTVICPFPMNTSSENLSHIDFFILNSPSVNGESVMLNFTKVTGKTEPNKPYLVRLNTEASNGNRDIYFVDNLGDRKKELVFSEIANKKEISGQPVEAQDVKATLFGTYVTQTFTTETAPKTSEVYGLKQANDKLTLISSTKKSTLPAFRAAVKIEELPAKAKNIILSFDGETTGITSINNDEMTSILGNVYSIDGKKVASSRDALVTLPAGIYIVNGKKVVIK